MYVVTAWFRTNKICFKQQPVVRIPLLRFAEVKIIVSTETYLKLLAEVSLITTAQAVAHGPESLLLFVMQKIYSTIPHLYVTFLVKVKVLKYSHVKCKLICPSAMPECG